MPSLCDTWNSGDPYEYFMGRWSKLVAPVFLQWLNVELLFVDDAARRQGVGRRLLAMAEHKARELGARNATLNTFEWQARAFYLKQGYEEFGRIDDYIQGFYMAYMKKALEP